MRCGRSGRGWRASWLKSTRKRRCSWPNRVWETTLGPNTERRSLLGRLEPAPKSRAGRNAAGPNSQPRPVQQEVGNRNRDGDYKSGAKSRIPVDDGASRGHDAQTLMGKDLADSDNFHRSSRQEARGPRSCDAGPVGRRVARANWLALAGP